MYTAEERRAGQRAMVLEGVFSRTMDSFTGGVILAGFALALGASDLQIGLLAAVPFLAQLANIPAVAVMGRFADRRGIAVWGAAAARILLLVMAVVPFLGLPLGPVAALIPVQVAYAVLATLSGAAWQVWVRELVPKESLGRYFGRRMAVLSAVGLVTLLLAGQFVTRAAPAWGFLPYVILFVAGALSGLVSCGLLMRAPSRPSSAAHARPFPQCLRAPVADCNFRRVLVFLGAWGFAANLALPFVSVVLLRTVGMSVALVTLFAASSQLANIAGLRLWAPLSDRYGNKPILGLSASVFALAMLLWAFVPKEAGAPLYAAALLLHLLLGFATAGLDLAGNGLVMKLAPEDDAPAYLATASTVKAVATGVAPLLAGVALTFLGTRALTFQVGWDGDVVGTLSFARHDFLFLASMLLGLYAIHRLLGFREEGEAPPEAVMRAMRREVSGPSSVAGMRGFAHLASYVVEAAYRVERTLDVRWGLDEDESKPARRNP